MLKRHIYTSTIANKLLVALCMLLLPLSSFAQVKKMIVEQPDTTPIFKGVQIMADVVGAVQLAVSDYGQYEAGVRVNLKDKYFPVVEIGYGKADHHNDVTQIDYKTSAPYGKIGIDFNVLKNKHDIYKVYAGARYAFTSFKFDVAHPDVTDPVWGTVTPYGGKDIKANCHWLEAVFGVDAKIWGPLRLGWSARWRKRIAHDNGTMGNTWYVPGFGKQAASKLAGTFNVTFEF